MKKNMGTVDIIIRSALALLIVILYFTGVIPGLIGIILITLAVVFVLTSLVGSCPLYLMFGIRTVKAKDRR